MTLTATSPNASEVGPGTGAFTLTRTGATTSTLAVSVAWSGTATFTSDYTLSVTGGTLSANRATVTFAAGSASIVITVTPVTDSAVEGDETVGLTVTGAGGYVVGTPASATVTIADAPPPPLTLSIADVTTAEADRNTTVTLTVTMSRAATAAVTVVVSTAAAGTGAGFATAGSDYVATTATLTIAAGQTTATFTVTIVGDKTAEPTESLNVVLSSPTGGAAIARGTAVVTITDADRALASSTASGGSTTLSAQDQPSAQPVSDAAPLYIQSDRSRWIGTRRASTISSTM